MFLRWDGYNATVLDTEVCDWCGSRFDADNAFFDMRADPVTRQGRLVTACSEDHLEALGQRAHRTTRPRRRRLAARRLAARRVVARRWAVRRPRTG
jgi:hypothetical protein